MGMTCCRASLPDSSVGRIQAASGGFNIRLRCSQGLSKPSRLGGPGFDLQFPFATAPSKLLSE
jgi:hypothetical protein